MTEIWSTEEFLSRHARPEAPSRNVLGGARAQASGKGFEAALEYTHAAYRAAGLADIWRLPVDTAPMPPGWMRNPAQAGIGRILRSRQKGDYAGWLPGGRAILMEAKATSTRARSMNVIPKGGEGSGLRAHQLEALADAAAWGVISALVWKNGEDRIVVPGPVLIDLCRDVKMGKIRRIDRSFGTAFPLSVVAGVGGCEDWLSVLLSSDSAQKVRPKA